VQLFLLLIASLKLFIACHTTSQNGQELRSPQRDIKVNAKVISLQTTLKQCLVVAERTCLRTEFPMEIRRQSTLSPNPVLSWVQYILCLKKSLV